MPKKAITTKKKTSDRVDCIWGLTCSLSSIDQQRNNISLFNVIDQLSIPKSEVDNLGKVEVVIPLEHEVVFVWRRLLHRDLCTDKVVTDVKISSLDPDGKIMGEVITQLWFEPGKRVMRFRVQNSSFKITKEGDYIYRAEIIQPGTDKFERVMDIPYNVVFS